MTSITEKTNNIIIGGIIMKIGIIGPCENEIMPFIDKIEDRALTRQAMLNFYTGIYENVRVVAMFSGVCKVNAAIAAQILIDRFEVTHILLTGVAGALKDSLKIGDIVIADEIAYHDVAKGILTEYHPWMADIYFRPDEEMLQAAMDIANSPVIAYQHHVGRLVTGEAFITENERYKLIEEFEPLCVDMESASVAHVCHANDIPFLIIRAISDAADENGSESFESNVEEAALHSLSLVEELIRHYGIKEDALRF
jgi:adenosylhomocysteine nucleosidase